MGLPLPYRITSGPGGQLDPDAIQGNFDELAKQYPLSRKHIANQTPIVVSSGGGAPAFQGTWTNFDTTTFQAVRFWRDPVDLVHIEGMVKSGTVPSTIFQLPSGYLPGSGLRFPVVTNTGIGWVDIAPTGNVVAQSGGNTSFSLCLPPFKQEN